MAKRRSDSKRESNTDTASIKPTPHEFLVMIRFNQVIVTRESRMIELKKEVNELCQRVGGKSRYQLDFEKEEMHV
jgi:hypothetical protein